MVGEHALNQAVTPKSVLVVLSYYVQIRRRSGAYECDLGMWEKRGTWGN